MLYNKEINIFSTNVRKTDLQGVSELLAHNVQGTLILAADLAIAGRLADALSPLPLDLHLGKLPDDPRAFNALCAYPVGTIPAGYRRIVLAGIPDGMVFPEDAEIIRLDMTAAWLSELPDVNQMREVYKAVRRLTQRPVRYDRLRALTHLLECDTGLSNLCCAASLLALHDMNLVQLSLNPIHLTLPPMQKTAPDTSAVWRAVQHWRAQAE